MRRLLRTNCGSVTPKENIFIFLFESNHFHFTKFYGTVGGNMF